ncbi:hypothetical protein EI42_03679 [Thermosporothrix hazakensis]|jgi:hypothetical protein|uniref:Uncharacterized protein n=2 Tax=Thermosporothrix TaxID=768650 RepID=A0A326U4W0_THEHA|nr:hypothetical protein [Thermosporothrix hazakensis]PZW27116.1 hypothetical protein EI42_03679 [Thermosporothrix hazakensis]BBH87985.1 hypothetical protein KTC_27360 [Thermosporothrix sp. COM3]
MTILKREHSAKRPATVTLGVIDRAGTTEVIFAFLVLAAQARPR